MGMGDSALAEALVLIGGVLRDYGALDECEALYARACALAPANANYALNWVHIRENQADLQVNG